MPHFSPTLPFLTITLSSLLLLLFLPPTLQSKDYSNYKIYRFTPTTPAAFSLISSLESEWATTGVEVWSSGAGDTPVADILVPPSQEQRVVEQLRSAGAQPKLLSRDVQQLVERSRSSPRAAQLRAGALAWDSYSTLEEIYAWLEELEQEYPEVVTVVNAGQTYQGRDILGVKVSFNENNTDRAVFVESNIHAREWITSAVSTYILNEFLTSEDESIRAVADAHDWYFFPVFNPDGFAYTHTEDRLWRKTRVPHNVFCVGTDPNRNWAYQWMTGGASSNPCTQTYAGPRPFSENSTRVMSEYISSVAESLLGYISFHSYSQLLLLSYGHTTENLDNFDELYEIGVEAMDVLFKRYGTSYRTGNIASTIYVASGGSMDWVKGTFGTPVTYTYELRDTGEYGFLLPPDQILPTSLETLDSFVSIFQQWRERHPEDYGDGDDDELENNNPNDNENNSNSNPE